MSEWVKCSEQLPYKTGNYLVYIKGRKVKEKFFMDGYFYSNAGCWVVDNPKEFTPLKKVTHWRPLLEPPKD